MSDYEENGCKRRKTEGPYEFESINPVILTNVSKLVDIASVAVAASLWNHFNVSEELSAAKERWTKSTTQWSTLRRNVIASIDQLPIPKPIADQVEHYVRKMANEITAWVSYHYRTVFLKNGSDKFIYNLLYHIVWYPNGAIDCVQTARSIIQSSRLSDVEKFRFACVYCLKEEMDKMPPSLFSNNVFKYVTHDENPLLFYWYCFYRKELDRLREIIGSYRDLATILYMLHHGNVDNWSAKQHFFDELNSDQKIREAIRLINEHAAVYQKAVLLKLNETQRVAVYMERAAQIIVNYTRPRILTRYILQTWFEARNLMSEDQFLSLFRELLSSNVKEFVLREIWTTASEEFRTHVVTADNHDVVKIVLEEWRWREGSNFLFVMLQDSSAVIRKSITTKTFFNAYVLKLITKSKLDDLNRLLRFFLPDARELEEFKSSLMANNAESDTFVNFKVICEKLITTGRFKQLEELLQFSLPDPNGRARFKINLVHNSANVRKTCLNFYSSDENDSNRLNNYLEQLLTPYPHAVVQYKRELVMSSHGITKLKNFLLNGRLDTMQNCIDRNLTSDQDKESLKAQVVGVVSQLMQALLRNNDESYLHNVLLWYFGDVNAVQQFKRSLSLDQIFLNMLKNCVFNKYHDSIKRCNFKSININNFDAMERLLKWYFESPAKAREFKKKIIYRHPKIDIFQTILRGSRGDDQLKIILQWFFKEDGNEIAKFKRRWRGGKITNFI